MTWCELRLPGCTNRATDSHHRRRRGQGGHEGPTVALCSHCHHAGVHANVAWANRHGLLLRTGDDPAVLVTQCGLDCPIDHREASS